MSLTAYTDSQDPWGSFHVLCYVGYPISYCKEKDLKKTTPRESKADSQTSLWCSVKSRYLHAYIHMVLRNLLQDSVISFYSIVFFFLKNTHKKPTFIVEISLSFKLRIRRKLWMYPVFPLSLLYYG